MKPRTLVMEGFGPFPLRQVVDFERYSDFLLITGPTGSGKTTIFDAIMFALYGRVTGTRDQKTLVSSFAGLDVEPFVELVFSIRNDYYKIRRSPGYERGSKRSSAKKVWQEPSVNLYNKKGDTWEPVTGTPSDINAAIVEKIHLAEEEFSRIVLLPQGEFQKFLVAETKEKMELLKKIFPVQEHEEISVYAREMRNIRKGELKEKTGEQQRLRSAFDPDTYPGMREKLVEERRLRHGELLGKRKELEEISVRLTVATETEKDFIQVEKLQREKAGLDARRQDMDGKQERLDLCRRALSMQPLVMDYRRRMKELQDEEKQAGNMKGDRERLARKHERAKEEAGKIPALEKELQVLRSETEKLKLLLPKESLLKERKEELGTLKQKIKRLSDGIGSREKDSAVRAARLREIKIFLSEQEDIQDWLNEQIEIIAGLREDIKKREREQVLLEEAETNRGEMENCEKEMAGLEKTLEINVKTQEQLQQRKESSMAVSLAMKLETGRPCPVCGSTDHPIPATTYGEAFTEEELLSAALNNVRACRDDISRMKERRAHLEATGKRIERDLADSATGDGLTLEERRETLAGLEEDKRSGEELRDLVKKYRKEAAEIEEKARELAEEEDKERRDFTDLERDRAVCESAIAELEKEMAGRTGIADEIERLEREALAKSKSIDTIHTALNDAAKKLEGLKSSLATLEEGLAKRRGQVRDIAGDIESKMKGLPFSGIEEMEGYFITEDEAARREKEIVGYRDEVKALLVRMEEAEAKIEGKERPEIRALLQRKNESATICDRLENERNTLDAGLRDLDSRKERYEALSHEIDELVKESKLLMELSDDLTGQNPRNISFQNFILGAYLRDVTARATERFSRMTDGRYSLHVNEEIIHGNRQAGLELDVFDAYTGTHRSVRSLSGGEKFLASISLSLGLADVIQNHSGHIELDAIFIDEGFGSLDDASLDRALTILDDLRENRMVGIISHVNELKTRIPSQINVIKGMYGSHIEQR
ncbi:MAG: hypothetical protein CVV44_08115 [Spirochaetae bacterium HGW-Spirochaetae-1]|nr:MAG: hypothetical protein CVV44_08115 [Spirochaetae bacterium HGW-Spirochaetae-1]